MLVRQISPNDPISAIAIDAMHRTCPLLDRLQFVAAGGDLARVKTARVGATTNIFRNINEDNSPTPPTTAYSNIVKKIVSFDASVDVTLEDRNKDLDAELVTQTLLEAESAGYLLQEAIIEGDATTEGSKEFSGLRKLVPTANVKAIGMLLPLGNSDEKIKFAQAAIETLLENFEKIRGGAQFALMHNMLRRRLLTLAKMVGYYRLSKDELGSEIEMIGDAVILPAGYKENGAGLLPFTETDGTSSIFAFRTGELRDLAALTSVGIKARYSGQAGNLITNNVNFDMALGLQNDTALYQFTGWKLDESVAAP